MCVCVCLCVKWDPNVGNLTRNLQLYNMDVYSMVYTSHIYPCLFQRSGCFKSQITFSQCPNLGCWEQLSTTLECVDYKQMYMKKCIYTYMRVSTNGGIQKWMVYSGKSGKSH